MALSLKHHHTNTTENAKQPGVLYHPRFYDRLSAAFFLGRRRRIWDDLVAASGVKPGDDVLDVGCGTGYFATRLTPAVLPGGTVTGVDPSAPMIDYCRQRAATHTRFEVGTAQYLPFNDHSFDVVVSSLAIHHIPPDTRAAALTEMLHVLRPHGRLLLADIRPPDNPILRRLITGIGHNALPDDPVQELRERVTEAGFVITGTGRHPLMHHVAAVRPATPAA